MRTLMAGADRDTELVDGVRLRHGAGWVLALPDPDEPVTHLWAEHRSDAEVGRLVQEYARQVRQLTR